MLSAFEYFIVLALYKFFIMIITLLNWREITSILFCLFHPPFTGEPIFVALQQILLEARIESCKTKLSQALKTTALEKMFCYFWQSRRGKLHVFCTFRAAWPHQRNSNVPWWVTPNYCSTSSGKPQAGKYLIIFAWVDSFASRKPSHLPALLLRL